MPNQRALHLGLPLLLLLAGAATRLAAPNPVVWGFGTVMTLGGLGVLAWRRLRGIVAERKRVLAFGDEERPTRWA